MPLKLSPRCQALKQNPFTSKICQKGKKFTLKGSWNIKYCDIILSLWLSVFLSLMILSLQMGAPSPEHDDCSDRHSGTSVWLLSSGYLGWLGLLPFLLHQSIHFFCISCSLLVGAGLHSAKNCSGKFSLRVFIFYISIFL